MFQLKSSYAPAGDQPKAIDDITQSFEEWNNVNTLLGATGTGKTFTMANIIENLQKPTLIISHNKTLAAQLATEFKHFFPNNAVHYFVSYFDYYQPESYLPAQDLYIEKEATINQEIEMYRLATMASLLTRKDTIVVASASSLYGLGQKRFFEENCLVFEKWKEYDFSEIKKKLLHMQYDPVQSKIEHGMFDFKGEMLDIFSSTEKYVYRLIFDEEKLEHIELRDSTTFEHKGTREKIAIWPATQFLQDVSDLETILTQMEAEKNLRVKELKKAGNELEAQRIDKRVSYDIRMIRETGFVNGIENYSLYFDQRLPGEPPNTIFDYFPEDMLVIVDESHMTLPQLRAMPQADRARKINLIKHWFRLPSAIDHRPLRFNELETSLGWKDLIESQETISQQLEKENISNTHIELLAKNPKAREENHAHAIRNKIKPNAKTLFVSATPAAYELETSQKIVEQIIRPTGLLDPISYVYPKSGDYQVLLDSVEKLLKKKPHVEEFLNHYTLKDQPKDIFSNNEE